MSKSATRTTVVSSHNPTIVGTSVTFTATVVGANGGAITGAVEFLDGKVKLGTVRCAIAGNTHPKFAKAASLQRRSGPSRYRRYTAEM